MRALLYIGALGFFLAYPQAVTLLPTQPVERDFRANETHNYELALRTGQFAYVIVDQRGIDLTIRLYHPSGKRLDEIDSTNGINGPEPVRCVADREGKYRIEIIASNRTIPAGRYQIRVMEIRDATEKDRAQVAARVAHYEGDQLRSETKRASYQKAADKYIAAVGFARQAQFREQEALSLLYLAVTYGLLNDKQKAIATYEEVLPLMRALGDRTNESITVNNLGLIYSTYGEKEKAIELYKQSVALDEKAGDIKGQGTSWNNIGLAYYDMGDFERSLDAYNRSLALQRKGGDRRGEARTLNNIGLVHDRLDDANKALEFYRQALDIRTKINDSIGKAYTLLSMGFELNKMGRFDEALPVLEQGLPITREQEDLMAEGATLTNLALTHAGRKEFDRAREIYTQALKIRERIGDTSGQIATLQGLAKVERAQNNSAKALAIMQRVIHLVEEQRSRISSQQLRTSYFATAQRIYELYMELLMDQGMTPEALDACERARARSFLELLSEARVDLREGVDPSLLEQERALQQALDSADQKQRRLFARKHTGEQADAVARELSEATLEYERLRAQIRRDSPRYADLTQPSPLRTKQIQQELLDADTTLVEFSLGENRSYVWVVGSNSIQGYPLPPKAEIEAIAKRLYETISERPRAGQDGAYREQAAKLSEILLTPVMAKLSTKRLIIVKDGALHYLPFAVLPIPGSEDLMGARFEMINTPSASTMAMLRRELRNRKPAPDVVAVIADPVFDKEDPRLNGKIAPPEGARGRAKTRGEAQTGVARTDLRFARLPFSRREADAILAVAPAGRSMRLLDFQANRQAVTSGELSRFRIVHFATHGVLNASHPELSGIVLSLVNEKGEAQDGFLRMHEMYSLRLPADLVVLSACQTAIGKEIRGEGLIGLTRGMMYAGAASVGASLWKVDDVATAELMKHFYRAMLVDGQKPAAALRQAQQAMQTQKRFSAPYFWAGFILQGE